MDGCHRCGRAFETDSQLALQDFQSTYWREPVVSCPFCGALHQKESRLSRLIAWLAALLLVLVFLSIWFALAIVLALYIYFDRTLDVMSVGAVLGLIVIAVYPGKYVFAAVKTLFEKRKIKCLEE